MKLRTLAEIATILAVIIAFLQYTKIEPNALDEIPELYRAAAEEDVKSVDLAPLESEHAGKGNPLYFQYKAAIAIPVSSSKDAAISKVVASALEEGDFKIAIAAAKEMTATSAKSIHLQKIVTVALATEGSAGFALMAAELIPRSSSKSSALNEVIDFYEQKAIENRPTEEFSSFDKYKVIYEFADSPTYINLSGAEAKEFTEIWVKTRDYKSFLTFKKLFVFADSPTYLSMGSEEAVAFALDWLDNYSQEEFEIYKEAFIFSDSPSGMSLSTADAMTFALDKVMEARTNKAANKQSQSDA